MSEIKHNDHTTLFALTKILVEMIEILQRYDYSPNDFLEKKAGGRWQICHNAPEVPLKKINEYLEQLTKGELHHYHSSLVQFSSCFTDELGRAVLLFRLLTPSAPAIEKLQRENFREIEKLPEGTVIESEDLIQLLKNEDPIYLRRLVMASLQPDAYYFHHEPLPRSLVEEMENVYSTYLTTGERIDTEVLRAITRVDRSGTSVELGKLTSGNDRIDYVAKMLSPLMTLSSFSIQSRDFLSRFVFRVPVMAAWVIGDTTLEINHQEEVDEVVDLFYAAAHFKDLMQERALQASRIWSMLHLGHPVYKELMDFARGQNHLMTNAFEGLVSRFAHALPILAKMNEVDHRLGFLLRSSNILATYATHKGAYIARGR